MRLTMLASLAALTLSGVLSAQTPSFKYVQGGIPFGVHVENSNDAWVTLDGGQVRFTTDGGATWSPARTPDDVRVQLRGIQMLDVGGPSLVGFCVGEDGTVLASTDGGFNWTKKTTVLEPVFPNVPSNLHSLYFTTALDGWVVGDDATIVYTADGGTTWNTTPTLPPTALSVHTGKDAYDIHFLNSTTFIVVMDYGTIARTTDLGATWTETIFDASVDACVSPQISTSNNLELWGLDFIGNEGIAVGGVGNNDGYILRTTDGGLTWNEEPCLNLSCASPPCLSTPPTLYGVEMFAPGQAIAVGYGSAVLVREILPAPNGPCTSCLPGVRGWNQKNTLVPGSDPPLSWVVTLNSSEAWWTGQFGIIRKSLNAGNSWSELGSLDWYRLKGGTFTSASNGLTAGQALDIRQTSDGGQSFTSVFGPDLSNGGKFLSEIEMNPVNGSLGVCSGDGGFVYRTVNGGASWSLTPPGISVDYQDVNYTPSGNLVYVVGGGGTVRVSTDDGATWLDGDPNNQIPGSVKLNAVHFISDSVGIAVGNDKAAYLTTNSGLNWVAMVFNGGGPLVDMLGVISDGARTYAVGQYGEAFLFDLGTFQFNLINFGANATTNALNDIAFVPGNNDVYIVGNSGTLLKYDGAVWSAPKSQTSFDLVSADFFAPNSGMLISRKFGIIEFN